MDAGAVATLRALRRTRACGWLLLGFLPWWTVLIVVAVDAAWSARRGDWSLAAFLAFSVAVFAAVAVGASLLF